MPQLSRAWLYNYTASLLPRRKYDCEKHCCSPPSIINAMRSVLFNGYFSVVDHPASFGANRTGGIFIDHNVVVRSHYNGSAVVARNMKQQLHDFVAGFGVEVAG